MIILIIYFIFLDKKRIYRIIHSGYGIIEVRFFVYLPDNYHLVKDTCRNEDGTVIDGRLIRSQPIFRQQKIVGYRPDCGSSRNSDKVLTHLFRIKWISSPSIEELLKKPLSDYMSLYSDPFVNQLQKWMQNESLIPLTSPSEIKERLGRVLTFKSTIEPRKPRLCLNARPLAGVLKKLPCRLNQLEELLPHLRPDSRVIISDDSSGKTQLHVCVTLNDSFFRIPTCFLESRGPKVVWNTPR